MNVAEAKPIPYSDAETTRFLPAERASRAEVLRQHEVLSSDPAIRGLIDSSLSLTMILNAKRQAVLINEAFRARLSLADGAAAVGARFGEYAGCIRACEGPSGCGTTEACRDCGAALAIASALAGRAAVKECRIRTVVCGQDLCLKLRVSPFSYKGEEFLLLSALDVAHEVRRRELEKIFFHDVLNTATGVQGLLHIMGGAHPEAAVAYLPIAEKGSDTLIDELLCQRDLAAAENGELTVSPSAISTLSFLKNLTDLFAAHPLAADRRLTLAPESEDLRLKADKTLLSRVLVNLIKNALEAVPPGATVTASCRGEGGRAVFRVHNPTFMPAEVQHQVFQRSFSTKGAGRGLGTHSVRLLTENYLGGSVKFWSDPVKGTTFRAAYPLEPAIS